MNRITLSIGSGIIAAASVLSVVYAHEADHKKADASKPTIVKGELIDTACFVASDGDAKGKEHAECASKCLGSGVPAGILPESSKEANGLLFLLTNPKPLAAYAGQTIHVEGTVNAAMHAVDVKKLHVVGADGKMTEIKLDDEHHKMGGVEDAAKDDGHKEHKH